jgi:hypothetical protein
VRGLSIDKRLEVGVAFFDLDSVFIFVVLVDSGSFSSSESDSELRAPSKDRGMGFGDDVGLAGDSKAIRRETRRIPEAKKSE